MYNSLYVDFMRVSGSVETSRVPALNEKGMLVTTRLSSYVVPEKRGNRPTRFLQYTLLSTYRKIFTLVFLSNLGVFVALFSRSKGLPQASHLASATSANLMIFILFRQENFVSIIYEIFTRVPHSLPLWVRKGFAKVFHYGGAHSGTGVSSVVWFMLYTATVMGDFVSNPTSSGKAMVFTSYSTLICFVLILISSHPTLRMKFHNQYEIIHRFASWTIFILFWIGLMFAAELERKARRDCVSLQTLCHRRYRFRHRTISIPSSCQSCTMSHSLVQSEPEDDLRGQNYRRSLESGPSSHYLEYPRAWKARYNFSTYRSIQESEAEAVFIISNPKATRPVVHGMESHGIAAYGAIFDS